MGYSTREDTSVNPEKANVAAHVRYTVWGAVGRFFSRAKVCVLFGAMIVFAVCAKAVCASSVGFTAGGGIQGMRALLWAETLVVAVTVLIATGISCGRKPGMERDPGASASGRFRDGAGRLLAVVLYGALLSGALTATLAVSARLYGVPLITNFYWLQLFLVSSVFMLAGMAFAGSAILPWPLALIAVLIVCALGIIVPDVGDLRGVEKPGPVLLLFLTGAQVLLPTTDMLIGGLRVAIDGTKAPRLLLLFCAYSQAGYSLCCVLLGCIWRRRGPSVALSAGSPGLLSRKGVSVRNDGNL
jgi:hypothetical protein